MSVPAYLRPKPSRNTSNTSSHRSTQSTSTSTSRPQPHPQHREFLGGIPTAISGEPTEDVLSNMWTIDREDPPQGLGQDQHQHHHQHQHQHHDRRSPIGGMNEPETETTENEGGHGHEGLRSSSTSTSTSEADAETEADSMDDWDNLRDGSIARRPAWRRPSPGWAYTLVGATVCMGMCMAPRAEIYINLACLAHPPQQHRSTTGIGIGNGNGNGGEMTLDSIQSNLKYRSGSGLNPGDMYGHGNQQPQPQPQPQYSLGSNELSDVGFWKDLTNQDGSVQVNGTFPAHESSDSGDGSGQRHLSPADEWFIKLQHDIYEYRLHHHQLPIPAGHDDGEDKSKDDNPSSSPSSSSSSSSSRSGQTSSSPASTSLPQPTGPSERPPYDMPTQDPNPSVPTSPSSPNSSPNRPYEEIDPILCKHDPKVQAAAAKITMVMTLTMGLLSAITTGFWGQTSDRIGRTRVLAIVESGLLINELLFVLVATFPYLAPGGYRALLFGPTIDGLLGGFSTMSATIYAYISDVTSDGSRATVFSRLAGILMLGFAVGPILGSLLIKATGNIMAPFYITVVVHFIFVFLILFVLPESLSTQSRIILTKNAEIARANKKRRDAAEREWENETPAAAEVGDPLLAHAQSSWSLRSNGGGVISKRRKRIYGRSRRFIKRAFHFLEPLGIFLPRDRRDDEDWDGRRGKDWNMTLVGVALFLMSLMMGIIQAKTQFTFYVYGWTSAELGPYMSLMGFGRGFVLLALIPVAMYYLKPYFTPSVIVEPVSDPSASAFSTVSSVPSTSAADETPDAPPTAITKKSTHLDLFILRTCLFLETAPYIVIACNPSATVFVIMTAILTLGSAGGPAINSLALGLLPSSREKGRLFGGIAVLHSIGASLLSPVIFGTIFAETVGWYAPTVFAFGAGILVIVQIVLAFVKLPKEGQSRASKVERGRSRGVKRVKSSGGSAFVGGGHH